MSNPARFALVLGIGIVISACGGTTSNTPSATPSATPPAAAAPASSTAAAPLQAPGAAKVGDRTKCPVSGEEFVVANDSAKAEYEGKTYYFCCPSCADTFKKDPTKYVH
jgi:YHS domain-containing protein